MKLGWSKEDQDCFVALTGGSRGLLPGRGKAPYHFAPGLTDGDKDYHLNHNTDSTCSFWEMMSCRFTIQALYSNKRQFFIENDRASYHTRAWHNLWFEQSTKDVSLAKWEEHAVALGVIKRCDPRFGISHQGDSSQPCCLDDVPQSNR
jgi:hypothetical protein